MAHLGNLYHSQTAFGRPSYQDLTRRADRACQLPVPDRTTRSAEHRGFC
jgi:hypothetical protein